MAALFLAVFGLNAAGPTPPEEIVSRLPAIRKLVGERTEYDGYVFKGPVRFHVGEATFAVRARGGGDPCVVLFGLATGGKFGYAVRAEVESVLDPTSLRVRTHAMSQTGSERRFKRLLFQKDQILYMKKKHCKDPNCRDPNHMVEVTEYWGIIPTGTKTVHCMGCKKLSHYVWKVRGKHETKEPFLDMLTALFVARTCEFSVGSSFVVPVVQDRDRWYVTVTAVKEQKVTVDAGTFNCLQVILQPKSAVEGQKEGRFTGLFGINGSIKVWLDKKTRLPVRILGSIPFAFMDLHCEVCLRKIQAQPLAEASEASSAKKAAAQVPAKGRNAG